MIAALLTAAVFFLLAPEATAASSAPATSAESALLMNSGGEILYAREADRRALIASTTKLMTALVVLDEAGIDELVPVRLEHCAVEGSSMYLRPGTYTLRELVTGLLLVSGNDAALALAEHVGGSVEAFACLMNRKAQTLGMAGSHFVNPHGLDDEEHYSTAHDLALLMAACLENPELAAILTQRSARIRGADYYNHNKLLTSCPGCLGGKTGYTRAAGRCLVSCCEREGLRLICVTLSDPKDWADHRALYDWGFLTYSARRADEGLQYSVEVLSGTEAATLLEPEPLRVFMPKEASLRIEAELPRFVFAPVEAGEIGGWITAYVDGRESGRAALRYRESIDEQAPRLLERLRNAI